MLNQRRNIRAVLLTAASVGALGAAAPAFAQSAAPAAPAEQETQVDEIIVTGFRASLADALNAKRESNLIIEFDHGRGHREIPRPEHRGIAAASRRGADRS
ncbi:hypothetical protein MMB232_02839 [Brevundimonas subvibrioides]|uniref:hypothetical protein n=1 Tax=Brevundimonas subvibrioides TaxID=74313 RepID=UPI0032D59757